MAGRKRCLEEATRTAPGPAEPYGPRRCGGPEHSVGLFKDAGIGDSRHARIDDKLTAFRADRRYRNRLPNQHFGDGLTTRLGVNLKR